MKILKKIPISVYLVLITATIAMAAAGVGISTWTALTTLADGDLFPLTDVSDTTGSDDGTSKKITYSNVKANLKTYNDTLYEGILSNEAGLYAALSDVSDFAQPGANETISGDWTFTGSNTYGSVSSLSLEGSTADDFEVIFNVTDPTADRQLYTLDDDMRIPASDQTNTSGEIQAIQSGTADQALSAGGQLGVNETDDQINIHGGATGEVQGEASISLLQHKTWSFDPDAVCDGAVDRLFLMTVGDDGPEGITIVEWKVSFEADPTTEADLDLKYADAFIGVANASVIDVLDTTAGVSSEDTNANINAGAAVANGKVLYLEFGTAYTETTHQIIFEMWYYAEED